MPNDVTLHAGPLRITLRWIGDRYAHVIELVEGERVRPLLESIEGTADDLWPPSPPLQSLHVERRRAEGRMTNPSYEVALLVGMAGDSHWSASVACDPAGAITFDVACRVRGRPEWLGSSYKLAADALRGEVQILPVAADNSSQIVIREDVYFASDPGGQVVKRTATAIRLTHLRSGIVVQCQSEPSLQENRAAAQQMLRARLKEQKREGASAVAFHVGGGGSGGITLRAFEGSAAVSQGNALRLCPGPTVASLPTTVRWCYEVRARATGG